MSNIPIMRFPVVALLIALATMLVVVGCGGTGEPAAEPVATEAVAATSPPAVAATAPAAGGESAPTRPSFVGSAPVTDVTPTADTGAATGELKTKDLIFLFSQQTRQGIMDCDVTGSATRAC